MELVDFKKHIESPINSVFKGLGEELKHVAKNRMLEYQLNEYKRNYFTKTLLHRSEPIKLTDFYLPLHIAKFKDRRITFTSDSKRISTENVSSLFDKSNYITIIGSAGSGKSTIVKYLFLDSVSRNFKIPIKVELRYLNEYDGSITDYIFDKIFLFHKLGFSVKVIDRLLNQGSFIFFFDGYDEINSSKKEQSTHDIDQFVNRYSSNYYLITSRPYTNIDTLPLFSNYVVCDLLFTEIPAFVKKQIPESETELAEKMIKAIAQIESHSYKSFLSNPLLLSMFILTYQSYSEIPQKRSDFYKQVFDTLYSVHDSVSKLSFVREKQSGLTKEGFEDLLKLFSFISYFEEKFLYQPDYLERKLTYIKEKKKSFSFENQKVIEDLQVAIGILNKDGLAYTFPHRSLQEFFAANYISGLSESNKRAVYDKIGTAIKSGWLYLIDNYHFLSLLAEQDYKSIVSILAIPLLEKEFSRAAGVVTNEYGKMHDILAKVYLISTYLLQPALRLEAIHHDFCINYSLRMVSLTSDKYLTLDQMKDYDIRPSKVMADFELLEKKGDMWIQGIKGNIEEQERSDSDIIGLI